VGTSQRHEGKWDEGKYRIDIVGNGLISYAPYTDISGLQIKITGGNSQQGIGVNEYSNVIYDNIIYGILGDDSQWNSGIGVYTNNSVIFNNIIYNFISANTVQNNGIYANGYPQVYIYNNTIYNSDRGIVNNTGGGGSGYFVLKNNLVQNCDVDYSGGNFSASSTHNLSSDNTAPAFGIYYRDAVVNFIDPDNADFHLLFTDASAKNAGLRLTDDPYLSFSTDIDGETRSTDKWDIGADEAHDARVKFRGTNFRIQGKVRIE